MADPANIDAIQAAKAQETERALRRQAVRYLLVGFRPHDDYGQLDYMELLKAAQAVLARELETLGELIYARL